MTRAGVALLSFLFLLSLRDVFTKQQTHSEDAHDDDFKKEFDDDENTFSEGTEEEHIEVREQSEFVKPQPIIAKDLPTLRFSFCVSCGYRQAYEHFSGAVREKYPTMNIEGENYPTASWKTYLAQFIGIAKMMVIATVLTGSNPFERMGFAYPGILQWAHGNKLSSCMMTFLLANMAENALLSSGAFEIYLGNELLWSKLESGRVPNPAELLQAIDSQLELLGKIPSASGSFSSAFNE